MGNEWETTLISKDIEKETIPDNVFIYGVEIRNSRHQRRNIELARVPVTVSKKTEKLQGLQMYFT